MTKNDLKVGLEFKINRSKLNGSYNSSFIEDIEKYNTIYKISDLQFDTNRVKAVAITEHNYWDKINVSITSLLNIMESPKIERTITVGDLV